MIIYFQPAPCNDGDIELISAPFERGGVVHVCIGGVWGTVCGGELDPNFASVICRQLGFSPYGISYISQSFGCRASSLLHYY